MPETETRMSPATIKELETCEGAGERKKEAARLKKENGEFAKEIREREGEMGIPPGSEEDPYASDGEEEPEAEECYQARIALPDHAEASGEPADLGERARAAYWELVKEREKPTATSLRTAMQVTLPKEEVKRVCEADGLLLFDENRPDVLARSDIRELEKEAKEQVSTRRRDPMMGGKTLNITVIATGLCEKSRSSTCSKRNLNRADWIRVLKALLQKREIQHEHIQTQSGKRISRLKVVDPSSLEPQVPEDADTWERLRANIKHPKLFSGDWHTIYLAEFTIVTETPRETRLRIIGR